LLGESSGIASGTIHYIHELYGHEKTKCRIFHEKMTFLEFYLATEIRKNDDT
jgi:hypothetical protein